MILVALIYFFFGGVIFASNYVPLAPIEGYVSKDSTFGNGEKGLVPYLKSMYRLGVGIATALAVLMIIWGGIEYMTTDAIGGKEGGKEKVQNAMMGLLLALGSYVILRTINKDFVIFQLNLVPPEFKDLTKTAVPNIVYGPAAHGPGSGVNFSGTGEFNLGLEAGENVRPGVLDENTTVAGKGTYYYAAKQGDYGSGSGGKFLDKNGNVIADVSPAFLQAARIEGTAILNDGRVLNYDSGSGENIRWKISNTKYGEGTGGTTLIPYRVVAADPAYYKSGQKLYVKELDGVDLPDGTKHNGFVVVSDTGSAIKGKGRLDIFTGAGKNSAGNIDRIVNAPITVTEATGVDN